MALFPLAALLLKFNRGRLYRETSAPLVEVLLTLAIVAVMIGGNVAIDPSIVGYVSDLQSFLCRRFRILTPMSR